MVSLATSHPTLKGFILKLKFSKQILHLVNFKNFHVKIICHICFIGSIPELIIVRLYRVFLERAYISTTRKGTRGPLGGSKKVQKFNLKGPKICLTIL